MSPGYVLVDVGFKPSAISSRVLLHVWYCCVKTLWKTDAEFWLDVPARSPRREEWAISEPGDIIANLNSVSKPAWKVMIKKHFLTLFSWSANGGNRLLYITLNTVMYMYNS